jgi:hypothetical protein
VPATRADLMRMVRSRSRSRTFLLAAIAAAAIVSAATAPARAATPGLVLPGGGGAGTPQALSTVSQSGAKWARVFMNWDSSEPSNGSFDQSYINAFQQMGQKLGQSGTKLELVVTNAPGWATGLGDANNPPQNPADFAAFFSYVVPKLKGSVAAWEIWNEEDANVFWKAPVDAARYAAILKAVYPVIKAADPTATVLVGGLTGNDYSYLDKVYAAGGGSSFDAVAVHTDTACNLVSPYSYYRDGGRIAQWSFLGYREVHQTMVDHGDGAKPIWMTELGWSTSTAVCNQGQWAGQKAGGVSEADQATFLKRAYHCLAQDPYVPVAMWFNLSDSGADTPDTRFGLMRADGSAKPAWTAFQDVVAHGDTLTGDCGDFTPPAITVATPMDNSMFTAELPISVSASDAGGVPRITLLADGKLIRNFTNSAAPSKLTGDMTWQGAKNLSMGAHTITVQALDPSGNVASVDIHVKKVTADQLPPVKTTTSLTRGKVRNGKFSFTARVLPATKVVRVPGYVQILFQKRVTGGKWKTAHKYTTMAKKPLTVAVKLEHARWRVVAVYRNQKPFRASQSKPLSLAA